MPNKSKSTTTSIALANKGKKSVSVAVVAKSVEKKAQPLIKKLRDFKIRTSDDWSKAYELTKQLKAQGKEAQAQLGTIIDPIKNIKRDADASIKAATAVFKPFFDSIMVVDEHIKTEMLEFQAKSSKKKELLEEKFEEGKVSSSKYVKEASKLENKAGTRMVWQLVEKDITKTPKQYLVPDLQLIEADLRDGKKVAGWAWEQVATIAI